MDQDKRGNAWQMELEPIAQRRTAFPSHGCPSRRRSSSRYRSSFPSQSSVLVGVTIHSAQSARRDTTEYPPTPSHASPDLELPPILTFFAGYGGKPKASVCSIRTMTLFILVESQMPMRRGSFF